MHLRIGADGLMERLGLLLGLVPEPLIFTTFGVGHARSIVAATRLGVFRALGQDSKTPEEVASETDCSPQGIRALLSALVGFGLLARSGGRYRNSSQVKKHLLPESKVSLEDAVLFLGYCHELVGNLEEDIRSGEIVRLHDRQHPAAFWDAYMGALASFARLVGPQLISKVKAAKPRRLLDVGGGHGRYAAAMCNKHEGLTADVLDLPEACAVGRRIQQEDGTAHLVTHIEGDFRSSEWPSGYDLVFIFNVTHNATEDEVVELMAKAWAALKPGGSVVIMDAVHGGDEGKLDASAGWNELFFFIISGAQAWPEARIRSWVQDAGFTSLRRAQLLAVPQFVLQATR